MNSYLLLAIILFILYFIIKSYISIHKSIKECNKYNTELSGFECANKVLELNNIDGYIIKTKEIYNDIYNYERNVVKLNAKVFDNENLSSCIIATFIASYSNYNNKLFKLYIKLRRSIHILIGISYIIFILSAILRDTKVLIYSIISIFILLTINILTKIFYNDIIKLTLTNLRKLKVVNSDNISMIKIFLNNYTYINVISFVSIIINTYYKIEKRLH